MQFNSTVEEFGYDDQSWLGSRRGTHTARTVTIDAATVAEFDGFIPSGIPLKEGADGKFEAVSAAGDKLAGFLLVAQPIRGAGDVIAPLLDTGRIRVSRLPEQAFDVSTLTNSSPHFVLVDVPAGGDTGE